MDCPIITFAEPVTPALTMTAGNYRPSGNSIVRSPNLQVVPQDNDEEVLEPQPRPLIQPYPRAERGGG